MANDEKKNGKQEIAVRFVNEVERKFTAEMGNQVQFTAYEKTLAQHLFLKITAALKDFEDKRSNPKRLPYTWESINMQKLALDAVHRVNLGLDALIPNHIHPVPYFNSSKKIYDLDLRIGYKGKDYYRRKAAEEEPSDIRYELVYETDHFKPIKKSLSNNVESYEFEIKQPFDRGKVVGGFGYIMYENPSKNKLVIVTHEDFEKARKAAGSDKFWGPHPTRMKFKTLVHRTTEELPVDPKKVNARSYAYVEVQDTEAEVAQEIEDNANSEVIDIGDVKSQGQQEEDQEQEDVWDQVPDRNEKKAHEKAQVGPGF